MNWIFFCIAAGIGALIVGIVGFGSSLIILPVLLITYPTMFEPETAVRLAVGTTMATMTIGAISAGIAQHRAKMVDWSLLKFLLLPYFLGALSGPWISQMLPAELIVIVIAVLLLVISMRILFLGKRSPKFSGRNWRSSTFQISGVHLIIAFISSIGGVASGVFSVPYLCRFTLSLRRIIGTSTVAAAFYSFFGTIGHISTGLNYSLPQHCAGFVHLPSFIVMSIVGAAFGLMGVKLGARVSENILRRLLGFFLLFSAIAVVVL